MHFNSVNADNFAEVWVSLLNFLLSIEEEKPRAKIIQNLRRDLQDIKNGEHILNVGLEETPEEERKDDKQA